MVVMGGGEGVTSVLWWQILNSLSKAAARATSYTFLWEDRD